MEIRRVSIHSFILDQKLKKDGQGRNSNSATFQTWKRAHPSKKHIHRAKTTHTQKRNIGQFLYIVCINPNILFIQIK